VRKVGKRSGTYSGGTGKSGDARATYHGPGIFGSKGHWHGPAGNRVSGPQRHLGDRDRGYYYSGGKVRKK